MMKRSSEPVVSWGAILLGDIYTHLATFLCPASRLCLAFASHAHQRRTGTVVRKCDISYWVAETGSVDLMAWVLRINAPIHACAAESAAHHGNLPLLKSLLDVDLPFPVETDRLYCCNPGHTNIVDWTIEKFGHRPDHDIEKDPLACETNDGRNGGPIHCWYCGRSHSQTVKFPITQSVAWDAVLLGDIYTHLRAFLDPVSHLCLAFTSHAHRRYADTVIAKRHLCDAIASIGSVELMEWASTIKVPLSSLASACAVEAGHLEMVKWLADNGPFTGFFPNCAASGGHVHILEWWHSEGYELQTTA